MPNKNISSKSQLVGLIWAACISKIILLFAYYYPSTNFREFLRDLAKLFISEDVHNYYSKETVCSTQEIDAISFYRITSEHGSL